MPHPDLNDKIRSLKRLISQNEPNLQSHPIVQDIYRALQKKNSRIYERTGINFSPDCHNLKANPNLIVDSQQLPRFNMLLKRDVDIVFHRSPKSQTIHCTYYNTNVDTVRIDKRILLENPYLVFTSSSKPTIQSWARPTSKSSNKGHSRTSRLSGKSRFNLTLDII